MVVVVQSIATIQPCAPLTTCGLCCPTRLLDVHLTHRNPPLVYELQISLAGKYFVGTSDVVALILKQYTPHQAFAWILCHYKRPVPRPRPRDRDDRHP